MGSAKALAQQLLDKADVKINGDRPWDIQVHDTRFYRRVLAGGSLALGESYMDGWWDCEALDEFFTRILGADLQEEASIGIEGIWHYIIASITNPQTRTKAKQNVAHHYDIGNDLYQAMLDETMTYSCGYWKHSRTLRTAQEAKYDLICEKIGLEKGMTVLDIGCGWGGFAEHAAKKYGARVLGVTLSENQATYAKERLKDLDAEIRLMDYRDVKHKFDRVVSIGMFEHVGVKNYPTFFAVARRCLKEDGVLLLHTIGSLSSNNASEPWITKYIFPRSMLPSAKQITDASEGLFVMEDWHNFGSDYDRTLMAWHKNFTKTWPELQKRYDERFKRMWEYYLLACAGSFRARKNQLWQIVFSPEGIEGGYERPE